MRSRYAEPNWAPAPGRTVAHSLCPWWGPEGCRKEAALLSAWWCRVFPLFINAHDLCPDPVKKPCSSGGLGRVAGKWARSWNPPPPRGRPGS